MATESFTTHVYFETKEDVESLIEAVENSRKPNLSRDIAYEFISDPKEIRKRFKKHR